MSYRIWILLLVVLDFAVFFFLVYRINSDIAQNRTLGGVLAGINLFCGFYYLGRLISNWSEWK